MPLPSASQLCTISFRWLVSLAVAMMMLTSAIAEAATCSPEPVSDFAAEASFHVDKHSEPSSDRETGQHKACPHGHCHHGTHAIRETAPLAMARKMATRVEHSQRDFVRTAHEFGLKRPPRA